MQSIHHAQSARSGVPCATRCTDRSRYLLAALSSGVPCATRCTDGSRYLLAALSSDLLAALSSGVPCAMRCQRMVATGEAVSSTSGSSVTQEVRVMAAVKRRRRRRLDMRLCDVIWLMFFCDESLCVGKARLPSLRSGHNAGACDRRRGDRMPFGLAPSTQAGFEEEGGVRYFVCGSRRG